MAGEWQVFGPVRFLQPEHATWLLAIPLAFACWFLFVWAKYRFRHRAAFGPPLARVSRLSRPVRDVAVLVAAVLSLGMLALAVMRPQVYLETQVPEYERADLVLVLDRSASMYAQDILPNRFSRAVDEIKAFLAHKPESIERVALVGFAGTSIPLSRLTTDLGALFFYLDWMLEDERLYFGTDLGAALTTALEVVEKEEEQRPAIYVVLSDGEDHGETLPEVLAELRSQQTRVHAIGIGGDAEVPIPVLDQEGRTTLVLDEEGEVLMTQFSEHTLRNIAGLTGGRYFRSVTGAELTAAMQEITSFERRLIGWTTTVRYRDLYREALMMAALATLFLLMKL